MAVVATPDADAHHLLLRHLGSEKDVQISRTRLARREEIRARQDRWLKTRQTTEQGSRTNRRRGGEMDEFACVVLGRATAQGRRGKPCSIPRFPIETSKKRAK